MGQEQYGVFRYLAASEHAAFYRALMLQFVAAKEQFIVHLRPDEIRLGLDAPREVGPALAQLVEWGNLKADPDTSRVATVEEFNNARYVYQLTAAGEAAERSLGEFDRSFGRAGALQSWALEDIVEQLKVLLQLAQQAEPDESKVAPALNALADRFTGLAANAQAFTGDLQRTIDLRDIDTDAFLAYKDRLIDYLQRFVQDLVARTAEIAILLDKLPLASVDALLRAAAAREARDAAPDAGVADEAFAAILARWQERFTGFRRWFIGAGGAPSQARRLRQMAVAAIPALLEVVARLAERGSGRSDRVADYRALAVWFADAPTDDDRHRLAAVAFGLAPARHLAIDDDTRDAQARQAVLPGTSWADAPPVEVSPRLRATGSYERRGKPTSIRDRSAERLTIARAVDQQRVLAERLREQLIRETPTPIGALPITDPEARDLLLHLLADALAQRETPAAPVATTSIDGAFRVEVTPDLDGTTALQLRDGRLAGPGHRIRVRAAS